MKKTVIVLLLLSSWFSGASQVVGRFFYNKSWELTTNDSSVFFRTCIIDTTNNWFVGQVRDFTKEGKLVMTGLYKAGGKEGEFVFMYPDGKIESQGSFLKNQRTGIWNYFYQNGSPKQTVKFEKDGSPIILTFNDSTGKELMKDGTGLWTEEFQVYRFPKKLITRGFFKSYQRDGEWTTQVEDGSLLFADGAVHLKQTYRNGKYLSGAAFDASNQKVGLLREPQGIVLLPYKLAVTESFSFVKGISRENYPVLSEKLPSKVLSNGSDDSDLIFTIIEQPAFPGCGMANFYTEIGKAMKYPDQARRMGIQGKVFVEFVIQKDGSLSDLKVIKGIGAGCDAEAIRLLNEAAGKCPWSPGTQRGQPVRQRYTLPIIFKLG